jgi:hypothetical protein
MTGKKTKTVVTTQVKTKVKSAPKVAKAPRSLAARLPGRLSDVQEKVVRMRRGIGLEDETPLESKTSDPGLLQKLKDLEAELFIRAGLIEPISKKQQIIDKLKNK